MEFKFPHTPHLAWLGASILRPDKVLPPDEVQNFLSQPLVVEEKVDGANLGIFFEPDGSPIMKNRNTVLGTGSHEQFQPLWPWLAEHQGALYQAMGTRLILFGEWCFAVHTVRYQNLPGYFIAFDVYDRHSGKFWSAERRDDWAHRLGIVTVPIVARGKYSLPELERILFSTPSQFGCEPAEGLYLRQDCQGWLRKRAKLVRPEFVQAIEEHWTKRELVRNGLNRVNAVPSSR